MSRLYYVNIINLKGTLISYASRNIVNPQTPSPSHLPELSLFKLRIGVIEK